MKRYCKTCKYRTIYNGKIYLFQRWGPIMLCLYIARVHSVATCFSWGVWKFSNSSYGPSQGLWGLTGMAVGYTSSGEWLICWRSFDSFNSCVYFFSCYLFMFNFFPIFFCQACRLGFVIVLVHHSLFFFFEDIQDPFPSTLPCISLHCSFY